MGFDSGSDLSEMYWAGIELEIGGRRRIWTGRKGSKVSIEGSSRRLA